MAHGALISHIDPVPCPCPWQNFSNGYLESSFSEKKLWFQEKPFEAAHEIWNVFRSVIEYINDVRALKNRIHGIAPEELHVEIFFDELIEKWNTGQLILKSKEHLELDNFDQYLHGRAKMPRIADHLFSHLFFVFVYIDISQDGITLQESHRNHIIQFFCSKAVFFSLRCED